MHFERRLKIFKCYYNISGNIFEITISGLPFKYNSFQLYVCIWKEINFNPSIIQSVFMLEELSPPLLG